MEASEQINCPAPLPEDPADALLTEMRTLAPYEVPEKKIKKKATGTRKNSRHQVVSDSLSDNYEMHSSVKTRRRKIKTLPLQPGRQEKEGHPNRGGQRVQEGKDSPSGLFHHRHRRRR